MVTNFAQDRPCCRSHFTFASTLSYFNSVIYLQPQHELADSCTNMAGKAAVALVAVCCLFVAAGGVQAAPKTVALKTLVLTVPG